MAVAEHLIWPAGAVTSAPSRRAAVRAARAYFLMVAVLGLAAFVLGIENRLTPGLFPIAPPVDLLPPLRDQAWYAAFALHQQDPVFAACGGSENLAQFKLLYGWEWLRRGSLLLLAGTVLSGFCITALWPAYRFALKPHVMLGLGALGYLAAVWCLNFAVGHSADLARYNVGQYRHALDVTFGSAALAFVLASACAPPTASGLASARPLSRGGWIWIGLIVLDICAGALFQSRDAISVWPSFPGYETAVLPPLERLTDYAPWWLNFTFNQYMIQLVHRMLSIGLWLGLTGWVIWTAPRNPRALLGAAALFVLCTTEMGTGVATLVLGGSAVASLVHEIGAVVLLAAVFVVLGLRPLRLPVKGRSIAPENLSISRGNPGRVAFVSRTRVRSQ
jgi:heme A synthase